MRETRTGFKFSMLVVAMMTVTAAWSSSEATARRFPVNPGVNRLCYSDGLTYSVGKCLDGQVCRAGASPDLDYWDSVANSAQYCGTQTSPGLGGRPQV